MHVVSFMKITCFHFLISFVWAISGRVLVRLPRSDALKDHLSEGDNSHNLQSQQKWVVFCIQCIYINIHYIYISYIYSIYYIYAYVCSFSPARPLSMAQSQIYRIPAQCPVIGTTTAPLEVWQNWHRREDLRIPASLRTSQQAFSPLHQPRVATGQFPHHTSHVDMGQFGVTSLAVDGQNPALVHMVNIPWFTG